MPATHEVTNNHLFPVGTEVGIYPGTAVTPPYSGEPNASPIDMQTMDADGVEFTGLAYRTEYVVAGEVAGVWRFEFANTGSAPTGLPNGPLQEADYGAGSIPEGALGFAIGTQAEVDAKVDKANANTISADHDFTGAVTFAEPGASKWGFTDAATEADHPELGLSAGQTPTDLFTAPNAKIPSGGAKIFRDAFGTYDRAAVLSVMANFEGWKGAERKVNVQGVDDPSSVSFRDNVALYAEAVARPARVFATSGTTFTATTVTATWDGDVHGDISQVKPGMIVDTGDGKSALITGVNGDTITCSGGWRSGGSAAATPAAGTAAYVDRPTKVFGANFLAEKFDDGESADLDLVGLEVDISTPYEDDGAGGSKYATGITVVQLAAGYGSAGYEVKGVGSGGRSFVIGLDVQDVVDYGVVIQKVNNPAAPTFAGILERSGAPISVQVRRSSGVAFQTESSFGVSRFNINWDGVLTWDGGSVFTDAGGATLDLTGQMRASSNLTARNGLGSAVTIGDMGGVVPGIQFGSDVKFQRLAANIAGTATGDKLVADAGLGVGNSAAATTLGSVTKKMEVFDAAGASLGFVPIYDAIT